MSGFLEEMGEQERSPPRGQTSLTDEAQGVLVLLLLNPTARPLPWSLVPPQPRVTICCLPPLG